MSHGASAPIAAETGQIRPRSYSMRCQVLGGTDRDDIVQQGKLPVIHHILCKPLLKAAGDSIRDQVIDFWHFIRRRGVIDERGHRGYFRVRGQ